MSHTIVLSGDYRYSSYKISGLDAGSTIDATSASWIVANSRNDNPNENYDADEGSLTINRYPFQVSGAGQGLLIKGGTINGEVPQSSDWEYTYANSAAMRIDSSPGATIQNWHITKPWDGIRFAGSSGTFTITDTWISNSRDDAVENDDVLGGTISDSLFDNVFSGVSLGDGDANGSANIVTFDGMLLRSKSYLYKGEMTHASPIKMDSSSGNVTPSLRFIDTVLAIEDVDHIGQGRLQKAWDKTIESRNNVFLNLSDTPLPSDYPKPGAGWTILQGQEARTYWERARGDWISAHGGPQNPSEPQPPQPPQPSINTIDGTNTSNTLKGTAAIDAINGFGGSDKIYGKEGNDILSGGSGKDTFIFDIKPNSGTNWDRISDFNAKDDTIQLENAVFTTLTKTGTLSSSAFYKGLKAHDAGDRIIYDTTTGNIAYDPDGSGIVSAIVFATLNKGVSLDSRDFVVI